MTDEGAPCRMVELFSGIGAQRMGFRLAGIPCTTVAMCEVDRFAIASYEAIWGPTPNLGDITEVERLPECDVLTYSFPCIRGDQHVQTSRGPIPIKDVVVGDKVLTHKGRFMPVLAHAMTGVHGTIRIHTPLSDLVCTRDHMVYTRFNMGSNGHEDESGEYHRKFTGAYWAPGVSLQDQNYIGYAVNMEEKVLSSWDGIVARGPGGRLFTYDALKGLVENEDFWWICGKYVADGWVKRTNRAEGTVTGIVIAIGKDKEHDVERISRIFPVTLAQERIVLKCHISRKELAAFVQRYFGCGAADKFISQEVQDMPRNLLEAFLDGYLSGDGHYNEDTRMWSCSSVSERLIRDLQQVIMKVHHAAPRYALVKRKETTIIEGRTVNQLDSHTLSWHTDLRKQDKLFYEEGMIWAPVKRMEALNPCAVYDITVDEDASFICEGMAVHNCTNLSAAGAGNPNRPEGMEEGSGTASSLLWEVKRLLTVSRREGTLPRWLVMENVPQVHRGDNVKHFEKWIAFLRTLGYSSQYADLDAYDFGVPQTRNRCFMVSRLGHSCPMLPSPPKGTRRRCIRDIMEHGVDERYFLTDTRLEGLIKSNQRNEERGVGFRFKPVSTEGPAHTITTREGGRKVSTFIYDRADFAPSLAPPDGPVKVGDLEGYYRFEMSNRVYGECGPSPTLTRCVGGGQSTKILDEQEWRIRKLTPREAWRCQGFPDWAFDAARAVCSDTQLYHQAGNTLCPMVFAEIAKVIDAWEKGQVRVRRSIEDW